MTIKKLEGMLAEGENYTIEFKRSVDSLSDDVFETVSSFSNRYGGYILLGVKEIKQGNKKIGEVIGVNPEKVADMKQNFINLLNNPKKIVPSLYLQLEEIQYRGKIVLWVYVPVSSQIELCCGRIYDRNGDADQDVTTSSDLVANISNRKSATYIERKIFPYATEDDLCMELIGKVRQMAVNRLKGHVWGKMSDRELLQSAGLYEKDRETGKEGFNMACILLLGKPEVIQSCVPGYKTDAIYRVENLDRYDDRLIVENNLVESYTLLVDFIRKHTNDKFFLIDGISMSVRDAIAREIVSNVLVHREFKSAFPAKLIIERDKIRTENWSRTQWKGQINLENFNPYPKNPIIANFFVNIGYADALGSGVRNLYKFTKIYSDAEPDFEENDIFRLTVPMKPVGVTETLDGVTERVTEVPDGVTETARKVTDQEHRVIENLMMNPEYKIMELAELLGVSKKTVLKHIKALKDKALIERVGSDRKGYWKINL